jgi:hypothetical protein
MLGWHYCPRHVRSSLTRMRVSDASPRILAVVMRLPSRNALVLVGGIFAGSACGGSAKRLAAVAAQSQAALTVPPGTFEFALPRAICDSGSRVGDTVTTRVTRPSLPEVNRGLVSIGGRDSTVPDGLKAFLRVSRVGASNTRLFPVEFAVDSFALDRLRGEVVVSWVGPDPEAVNTRRSAAGTMIQCYGGAVTGQISSALVLRER